MIKEVITTGVKYYQGISAFDINMEVVVEFDSENTYSQNAFSVLDTNGVKLGSVAENPHYIPRKICSEDTILSSELKQLINDGFTIVKAIVKDIVRNFVILTVELEEKTSVLPTEAVESTYTVVGTKYHSTNANVGDIVRFKVINGTTTLFNEEGALGVLPQSDKKIKELESIGAPIVLNRFGRADFNTLENVFVVSYIEEDKYIFLKDLEEEDLKEENGDEIMNKELKDLVEQKCKSIIKSGGEITDIEVNADLSVKIHFLDHMCDAYGGFRKVATVRLPQKEIVEEKSESMEEKLEKITKETITQSVMDRKTPIMVVEMQQDGLLGAFNRAKKEYPVEVMAYTTKYLEIHPVGNILLTLRAIDDTIAKRYLNGQISGAEFDHMRAWISINAYFYYEHIIEEVDMEEFFTEASLKASKKFLKEEEERECKMNKEVI